MSFEKIEVRSLETRVQNTKGGKTLHWQKVGLLQEDQFPLVFEVFLPEGRPLPLGQHQINLAYRADQWNSLQVDPFNSRVSLGK